MTEQPSPAKQAPSDEIDLIEVIRHIWNGRWLIVKVTLAFMVLGLVIAFTTTEQFKSEARLLPEIRDTRGGASALLRQFGGLGGLNLPMGEGADAIRPDLYPDVLKSTPFFVELLRHEITTEKSHTKISVRNYVEEHMSPSLLGVISKYTIRLPWTIMGWIRGVEPEDTSIYDLNSPKVIPQMSQAEFMSVKTLRDRINASIDQRTGVISVSSEFPDRKVAAQITQFSLDYLTDYITDYRIQKAQKDLEFVKERHDEKKQEFHQAQINLARFRDANRNIVSAAAQTEEQRLQDQYNLAFNVYNGLAQQLEQSRIKVQEETPVIKVLEPVSVPVQRSKPRRGMVMVVSVFLGGFVGIGLLFILMVIRKIKYRFSEDLL